MARAPLPGLCKTRLARVLGDDRAAELYRAMLVDTLAAYSNLPFCRRIILAAPENDGPAVLQSVAPAGWNVCQQVGSDLGARLGHARASLAPGRLILASSDSPILPLESLRQALADWTDERRVLLGRCHDGGYYLIGLATAELGVFQNVAWSTERVADQTIQRCRDLGLSVHELPTIHDVDEPADVERLRDALARDPSRAPQTGRVLGIS